jgi:hypothetical protein
MDERSAMADVRVIGLDIANRCFSYTVLMLPSDRSAEAAYAIALRPFFEKLSPCLVGSRHAPPALLGSRGGGMFAGLQLSCMRPISAKTAWPLASAEDLLVVEIDQAVKLHA